MKQIHLCHQSNIAYNLCDILEQNGVAVQLIQYALDEKQKVSNSEDLILLPRKLPLWFKQVNIDTSKGSNPIVPDNCKIDASVISSLAETSSRYGERWQFDEEVVKSQCNYAELIDYLYLQNNDFIIAYDYAAIIPLLHRRKNFIMLDTGVASSEIVSDCHPITRLLAIACKRASAVITLNPKAITFFKEQLNIDNCKFIPYPLNHNINKIEPHRKLNLKALYQSEILLCLPLFHNSDGESLKLYLHAINQLIQKGIKLKLLILQKEDIQQSLKTHIQTLKLSQFVDFIHVSEANKIIACFYESDFILDVNPSKQILNSVIQYALCCGTPVITSADLTPYTEVYPSLPPISFAHTAEAMVDIIISNLNNRKKYYQSRFDGQVWSYCNHTNSVIYSKFQNIVYDIIASFSQVLHIHSEFINSPKKVTLTNKAFERRTSSTQAYPVPSFRLDIQTINFLKSYLSNAADLKIIEFSSTHESLLKTLESHLSNDSTSICFQDATIIKNYMHDFIIKLNYPNNHFDIIICYNTITSNSASEKLQLNELKQILKPNGLLLVINLNSDNIGTRSPYLAHAHICLHHMLLQTINQNSQPLNYFAYHALDYRLLAMFYSEYFSLEDCTSTLPLSHFYYYTDFNSLRYLLGPLNESVANQPGLYMIYACRKTDQASISNIVQQKLSDFDKFLSTNQILQQVKFLYEFSEHCFKDINSHTDLLFTLQHVSPQQILDYIRPESLLLCNISPTQLNFNLQAVTLIEFIEKHSRIAANDIGKYDMVVINVDKDDHYPQLLSHLKAVKSFHYILLLYPDSNTLKSTIGANHSYLEHFKFLRKMHVGSQEGMLLCYNLYTPVDFYETLESIVQNIFQPKLNIQSKILPSKQISEEILFE